jgi:hypothetical protein
MNAFDLAPRALPPKDKLRVRVTLTPWELHFLVRELERRASIYAEFPDLCDVAQAIFDRVAELREAVR